MSYPNIIYGDYGDEKVTSSVKARLDLGTIMILPDGRTFARAKQGGTTGVAGKVYIQEAVVADHGNVAGSALAVGANAAIGATTVVVTMGGTTAITVDQYEDGYMTICAGTVGMGHIYKIKSNNSAAVGATTTIKLETSDPIKVALVASSTLVNLRTNAYAGLVLKAAGSTFVGNIAGVLPVAAGSLQYCWVQRTGVAAVFQAATATSQGNYVCCSSTDAGAVSTLLAAATTLYDHFVVGQTIGPVDNSGYAPTMLRLPV